MSFFGFDTTLPRDRPSGQQTRGIFENPDPFAHVAHAVVQDDEEAIDFEDTYDGLGDQLDEDQDAFNDDTFGGGADEKSVGKDFDFYGKTAQMSNVLDEEQMLYKLKHPPRESKPKSPTRTPAKPTRTGYELYQDPGYIPEIQAKSAVWGTGVGQKSKAEDDTQPLKPAAPAKKIMSLEEVEAQMRAQSKKLQATEQLSAPPPPLPTIPQFPVAAAQVAAPLTMPLHDRPAPPPDGMLPLSLQEFPPLDQGQYAQLGKDARAAQAFQRQQPFPPMETMLPRPGMPPTPNHHQNRLPPNPAPQYPMRQAQHHHPKPQASMGPPGPLPATSGMPPNMVPMTEEQRKANLIEDAKRAKRNHKIFLLSKGNGLMTPQDKNFITRIQLQQLVAATGNVTDPESEASLSEDFYYQVYSQIRGAPRQHPRQPLDHERNMPPPPDESDLESVERHMEWRQKMQSLNQKLWADMKILEPIVPGSSTPHPFIAFLSYPKGKKAIPRIFRQIDQEQRVTILTMIIVHLDSLDVVQRAQLQSGESQPPLPVREEVDLFSHAVMPSLLGYVNEAPINIITGLLGLVIGQTHVQTVAKTRVGLGVLTMLLSRAELVKEAGGVEDEQWKPWTELYNTLFDRLEPVFGDIFPGTINSGDDMYVWQFLAAVGIGASPEQQQRLVIAVKDRVMETVAQSKTLPADMASQRLGNVNLFMRAIGLDVELLG
ncbi:topisomerase II [Histoplasma capsulatum H143]|uniref:Topisomerase II n=1 Tax=Ajellomyces capsulatus (strain H143) TaxID=544712 RepID=C6HME1_AJECH|nr:topisomerase II [Histoplasma capsulatum H143]